MTRASSLIDGEHYAAGGARRDRRAAVRRRRPPSVVGGTEKIRGGEDYGVPLVDDLDAALEAHEPDLVYDLSDEPVLGPVERFRLASRVLARGLPYVGADFRFDPPELAPFELPSLARHRAPASASARPPSAATSRGCSPEDRATSSSSRWAAAGRPSRSWPR